MWALKQPFLGWFEEDRLIFTTYQDNIYIHSRQTKITKKQKNYWKNSYVILKTYTQLFLGCFENDLPMLTTSFYSRQTKI